VLYRLLPGFLIIPFSYWVYTLGAIPRFRCHVSSWTISNGHFLFELVPYVFIITSFALLFRTARHALLHSSEFVVNILTLALAFEFSVFTFAVGYYQFGLTVQPDLDKLLFALDQVSNSDDKSFLLSDVFYRKINGEWSAFSDVTRNIWDYVWFSLSASLGDDKITGVKLCSEGTFLRVIQDISNAAFALLSVTILVRFEPPQH
jgi:hypothetical protein